MSRLATQRIEKEASCLCCRPSTLRRYAPPFQARPGLMTRRNSLSGCL
ncbi:hypothetical protein [Dickeya sp. CFBP 2040]|nr:hypothetical protein [Dickeya sp. CFBP 2040]